MVVNKFQRGFSWDSYTRFTPSTPSVINSSCSGNERPITNESITISEPLVEWVKKLKYLYRSLYPSHILPLYLLPVICLIKE